MTNHYAIIHIATTDNVKDRELLIEQLEKLTSIKGIAFHGFKTLDDGQLDAHQF